MSTPGKSTVRGTAGASARQMEMKRLATGLCLFLVLVLVIFLFTGSSKRIVSFGIPGVVAIAVLYGVVLKTIEKTVTHVTKRANDAGRGAVAEEKVGSFLGNLPEGNFVIHDFDSGRGNIDHILINQKGIFTLETKSHKGLVSFDGSTLLLNGRPFEKDFIKQAWAQCYLVREILAGWGIAEPKAEPVILFTNAIVKVRGKAKGVEVATIEYLRQQLSQMPDRLTIPEAGRIFNRLKAGNRKS